MLKRSKILAILIILFAGYHQESSGQHGSALDSMYQLLISDPDHLPQDSNTVNLYYHFACRCADWSGAWNGAKEPWVCYHGFDLSRKIGYQKGIDEFLSILAYCFKQKETDPVINIAVHDDYIRRERSRNFYDQRKALHGGSVDWYCRGIKAYLEMGRLRDAGIATLWQGMVYYDQESYRKALQLFLQARTYLLLANDQPYLFKTDLFLGCTYYFMASYDSSLMSFNRAVYRATLTGDSLGIAKALINRGEVNFQMGKYVQSLDDFERSDQLEKQCCDTCERLAGKIRIARGLFALKRGRMAQNELESGLKGSANLKNLSSQANALYLLSLVQKQNGDVGGALSSLESFLSLRDSLFAEELTTFINGREYFWINKIGRQITNHIRIAVDKDNYYIYLERTRLILGIIMGLIIMISVVAVFLYRDSRANRRARKHLNDLNQTRERFFSIISHDLRAPVLAMNQLLTPLIRRADHYHDAELVDSLHEMEAQTEQTYLLIDNLLYWSRSQQGSIPWNPVPFLTSDWINHNLSLFVIPSKIKDVRLSVEEVPGFYVLADRNMCDLILRNLLDNAIKFSERGGVVRVSVEAEPEKIRVSISDYGTVLPDRVIAQLNGKSADSEGPAKSSGLGLVLVREFVSKHRGEIIVTRLNHGNSIAFTLPYYKIN